MTNPRYCFTDDHPVRHLKEAWLLEIGTALNSDLPENWIALATRLGLDNDLIEQFRRKSNPGYEALRHWRTGPNSTIRVLHNALTRMKRFDVIDRLTRAKTDPTDVTIVIRCDGAVCPLEEGGVPGLTTLFEFVRPHIRRSFSQLLAKRIMCARLSPRFSGSWTSPVAEFRGQQIDIELSTLQRTQVRSAVQLRQRQHVHVERDSQSYVENDLLVFEVPGSRRPPSPPSSPSSPSSSLCFENLHPEDSQSDDLPLNPSPALSPGQEENYFYLRGFHPEIPTDDTRRIKAVEALKDNLWKNGAYVLRRTTQENHVLVLSVVNKRRVIHFSIMKDVTDASCIYFIFSSKSFSSVSELIEFYHHNSLCSSDTTDGDTRELLLTTPVF